MLNKKYWILLIVVTIIAIFPRALEVFNPYNYFFNPEQGIEYLVTKSIVVDHQVVLTAHQGGFGDFFKGPGFNYLLTIPFILTSGDPFGGRLMMLVISVLTVPFAFIFSNRMFGLKTASLISFLLAVSPNLKDYAGGISPPFVMPLLTVLFIYFLFMAFHGHKKYIPLLIFIVGLMTHFEMAAAGILLTLLILTGLVCLAKKTIPYRYYLLSIGSFALAVLPLIVFDIKNDFYNVNGVVKMIDTGKTQASNSLLSDLGNLISNRIDVFAWNFISTFSPNLTIWLLVLIIFLFGVFLFARNRKVPRKEKIFVSYLGLIPVFSFLFLIIYPGNVINQWWIIYLTIIYCFLLGIVLNYLWKYSKIRLLIVFTLFVLSLAFLNRTIFIYKTQFIYPPDTYIKEDSAIKYIFRNSKVKPFGIVVLSARAQENYDYLIWWNGRKYNYQPYRIPKKTYYTIIEPNITYSSDKTPGVLIESKKMQNGFIIEKRIN